MRCFCWNSSLTWLLISLLLFLLSFELSAQNSSERTWTSADGRSLKGTLLKDYGWKVSIKRGTLILAIPRSSLSVADHQWLDQNWTNLINAKVEVSPLSGMPSRRDPEFAKRVAKKIIDQGFVHPAWRVVADGNDPDPNTPSFSLIVREGDFNTGSELTSQRVIYVLLESKVSGGTLAYAEVPSVSGFDPDTAPGTLIQHLISELDAHRYDALVLGGKLEALQSFGKEILGPGSAASLPEQRDCLIALGSGRSLTEDLLVDYAIGKLSSPELCLPAARALGLSKRMNDTKIIDSLVALQRTLSDPAFRSQLVSSSRDIFQWNRLGVRGPPHLDAIVHTAISRLREGDEMRTKGVLAGWPRMKDEMGAALPPEQIGFSQSHEDSSPLVIRRLLEDVEASRSERAVNDLLSYLERYYNQSRRWKKDPDLSNIGRDLLFFRDFRIRENKAAGAIDTRFSSGQTRSIFPMPYSERIVKIIAKDTPPGKINDLVETIGMRGVGLFPLLAELFNDSQRRIDPLHRLGERREFVRALTNLLTNAEYLGIEAIPPPGLIDTLIADVQYDKDKPSNLSFVRECIEILQFYGKHSVAAIPALEKFGESLERVSHSSYRIAAKEAVEQIRIEAGLPPGG